MTNGAVSGTSGERAWLALGWLLCGAVITVVAVINVMTIVHEQPQYGLRMPIVWEGSSALTSIGFAWLAWVVVRWSTARPAWVAALAHLLTAVVYSALHVGGFIALRTLAYATAGARYDFGGLSHWTTYELPKDLLAYAMMVTAYWLVRRLRAAPSPAQPEVFDIRDGARLVRAPIADILAVSSAGNYAEFVLTDGRRPLMRSSLAALETALTPRGFVRTHRSWLVNTARVTGLQPEGSGDYTVEVGALSVPLSRRFPDALARLRQG